MQEHVQVESSKCKACRRCEIACIASHHGLDFKTAMKQKALYSPRCWAIKGDEFKTSVRCHCCDPAPCCNICPTGALHQNPDGSFTIHPELCAGCMMCASVCPYGVISPEVIGRQEENAENLPATPARTIAIRCDLCHDWRLEKGVEYTACMEACLSQALSLVKKDGTIVQAPKPEKKPAAKPAVAAETPKAAAEEEKKKLAEPVEKPAAEQQAEVSASTAKAETASEPQPESQEESAAAAQSNGDKQDKKSRKGKKKK